MGRPRQLPQGLSPSAVVKRHISILSGKGAPDIRHDPKYPQHTKQVIVEDQSYPVISLSLCG